MWTLQRIFLRRGIPRYQKRQFAHVLNSRSYQFRKIYRNAPAPEFLFNLQPSPLLKKRRRYIQRSVSFANFFRNTFNMEKLLQTGFDFGKHLRKLLAWNPFLLKMRSSNKFQAIFFYKFAEVLGQHLKSLPWRFF